MVLKTKEELKAILGSKSLFRKTTKTEPVLNYVSGVYDLTLKLKTGEQIGPFYLTQYPMGLLFSDSKKKYRFGLKYSQLRSIEIIKKEEDGYEVVVMYSVAKPIVFSFNRNDRFKVIPFIKLLSEREDKDPRNVVDAREQILKLKDEFATDYFSNRLFDRELNSTLRKNSVLKINPNMVKYGNTIVDPSKALGYTISIEKLSYHGISRFEYIIGIYQKETNLFIYFDSTSFFERKGEHSDLLSEIELVLFDVISRPIVANWFEHFANNDDINFKEFSISRHGLLIKTMKPHILIHWDEIVAEDSELFRWPYSNRVFQQIDAAHDYRGIMLYFLTKWLQQDPERLFALMGREYLIS